MSTLMHRTLVHTLATLVAAVAFNAQAGGGGHGGHGGHGGGWGHSHGGGHTHWSVGVGVGFGYWPYWGGYYPGYYYPGYYYPSGWAPGYAVDQPAYADPPLTAPAPAYTPRGGQSAAQLEADQRLCDREAMASPAAMADASIFHRIVLVCMENRGYAVH